MENWLSSIPEKSYRPTTISEFEDRLGNFPEEEEAARLWWIGIDYSHYDDDVYKEVEEEEEEEEEEENILIIDEEI